MKRDREARTERDLDEPDGREWGKKIRQRLMGLISDYGGLGVGQFHILPKQEAIDIMK